MTLHSWRVLSSLPMLIALAAVLCMAGCGGSQQRAPEAAPAATHDHADHDHHHHHIAPRGGTLIELGDHVAHMEWVLNPESGQLKAFVLDAHTGSAIRLGDVAIDLVITLSEDDAEPFSLPLTAQINVLTGEEVGDTSEFAARSEHLIGAESFRVYVPGLRVRGVEIQPFEFDFPEGSP